MKTVLLSICIPTYNFGKFIGETLNSIVCQLEDDVEIVIIDGASTDNTSEVVKKYQEKHPQIKYFLQKQKGGIDYDMALSVAVAQGKYCWLFSSDDVMKEGAIKTVLREIKNERDVYICGFTLCGLEIEQFRKQYAILNTNKNIKVDLSDRLEREAYFEKAITTPAFFSFMSSIILKKESWEKARDYELFMGGCWAHAARFFSLMRESLILEYIAEPLLNKRSGNDSFLDKGLVHRLHIGIDNFQDIADYFWGKGSKEAFHVRRTIRNETGLALLYAKATSTPEEKIELNRMTKRLCSDRTLASLLYYLSYKMSCKAAYLAYKKLKKMAASIGVLKKDRPVLKQLEKNS